MKKKALMVQGTASHVGKSFIVSALCRWFHRNGWSVAPFKAQNMALNSFVTTGGAEIGRAQAVQSEAAGIIPCAEMNPILLKPSSDSTSQVICLGKPVANLTARGYHAYQKKIRPVIEKSLKRLWKKYDLIIIEGAGSPAEINLKKRDLANMYTAGIAKAPVILVGDIDRGGVFASLCGTYDLLSSTEKKRIRGIIINRMRGDFSLLKPGVSFLEKKTTLPVLGVLPYMKNLTYPEEDSLGIPGETKKKSMPAAVEVVVIRFPYISNYTDFEPLEKENRIQLRYVSSPPKYLPDILILPGTKSTINDLRFLKKYRWDKFIHRCINRGKKVLGICGGYQMLGRKIIDPSGVESHIPGIKGLGVLPFTVCYNKKKITRQVEYAYPDAGCAVKGYEIRMGQFRFSRRCPHFFKKNKSGEGTVSDSGNVFGTNIHGLFENDSFTSAFIFGETSIKKNPGVQYRVMKEETYNRMADILDEKINMDEIVRWLT